MDITELKETISEIKTDSVGDRSNEPEGQSTGNTQIKHKEK